MPHDQGPETTKPAATGEVDAALSNLADLLARDGTSDDALLRGIDALADVFLTLGDRASSSAPKRPEPQGDEQMTVCLRDASDD